MKGTKVPNLDAVSKLFINAMPAKPCWFFALKPPFLLLKSMMQYCKVEQLAIVIYILY